MRLILPGELAKHGVSEGVKAVYKYTGEYEGNDEEEEEGEQEIEDEVIWTQPVVNTAPITSAVTNKSHLRAICTVVIPALALLAFSYVGK